MTNGEELVQEQSKPTEFKTKPNKRDTVDEKVAMLRQAETWKSEGKTDHEIAKALNRSKSTINAWFREHGGDLR